MLLKLGFDLAEFGAGAGLYKRMIFFDFRNLLCQIFEFFHLLERDISKIYIDLPLLVGLLLLCEVWVIFEKIFKDEGVKLYFDWIHWIDSLDIF